MPIDPSSIIGQQTMAFSTPVVLASDQSPITTTQTGTQTVTVVGTVTTAGGSGGGGTGGAVADESVFTEGSSLVTVIGGEYTTSVGTVTSGSLGGVQITALRAMHVNLRNAAGAELTSFPVSGTVTAIPSGTTTVVGTTTAIPSGTYTVTGTVTEIPSGTQTVTGTVAVTGTSTVAGTVTSIPSGTQTIAGTVTTTPTGTQTIAPTGTQTVTVVGTVTTTGGGGGATGQADDSIFTEGTTLFQPVGGEYNTSAGMVTPGSAAAAQITAHRGIHVNLRHSDGTELTTETVTGTVVIVPSGTQTVILVGAMGQADNSVFTEGTTTFSPIGGEYTTNVGTVNPGSAAAAQITQYRAVHVSNRNATGTEIFTSATPGYVQGTFTYVPSGTTTVAPTGTQTVAGTVTTVPPGTTTVVQVFPLQSLVAVYGTITSTATTSQNLVTHTITNGKTFFLSGYSIQFRPTTLSTAGSIAGYASLQSSASIIQAYTFVNPTDGAVDRVIVSLAPPLAIGTGTTVIGLAVTPAAVTSDLWIGNMIGYEQ